jgi:adenosylmethionine-8-amino-7-oxononanoate aminotransferase
VWHGFTQMSCYADSEPLIVEAGEGRELIDVDGRRYLDAISSLWVTTLGHRVPELDAALAEQAGRIAHSTMLGNGNRITVELAEALASVVPLDEPHFLFASDGAAAVEQAIKAAFQYWANLGVPGRTAYLALDGAYHGDTVGSLSVGAGGFGTDLFDPLRFPVLRAPTVDAAIGLLAEHAGDLAAVVIEPLVQGAAGMVLHEPDALQRLGTACRAAGVLLICDEVATGFGRTGTLFASEQCGLRPDLMALGKGLTGGYLPLSVCMTTENVYETFYADYATRKAFLHSHSYTGNPLACAAALATLGIFQEDGVLNRNKKLSTHMAQTTASLAGHAHVAEVRQTGMILAIEIVQNRKTRAPFPWQERRGLEVYRYALEQGALLRPLGDVIYFMPPYVIQPDELDWLTTVALEGINRATT